MSETNIVSPPYPAKIATVNSLYGSLRELRAWLVDQMSTFIEYFTSRQDADAEVTVHYQKTIEQLQNMPKELESPSIWQNVSVIDHYVALMFVRCVREQWDAILRDHEDNFDSTMSIQRRMTLLLTTRDFFEDVFTSPEARELQTEKKIRKWQKMQAKMTDYISTIVKSESDDDDAPDGLSDYLG